MLDLEDTVFTGARKLVATHDAAEIASAAVTYTEYVRDRETPVCSPPVLEQKIKHATIPDFGGTVDCILFDGDRLHIVDLKTGRWPAHAEQLACYALLARQEYPRRFVAATIVQPRANDGQTLRNFLWDSYDLDKFEDRVRRAAESDDLVAGPHCRFCTLRPTCKAFYPDALVSF